MGEGVLTAGFSRVDGALRCEGVPLERVASAVGTPAYVYSAGSVREQYRALTSALAAVPHRVHYSVKANANLALLRLLGELGAGVDIVSGGELHRALLAGFRGSDVVFSGVGKTEGEMRDALAAGVLLMNVESEGELRLLNEVASSLRMRAPVALRVNPEVDVDTPHAYTRTGERGKKFGIPYDEVLAVARLARSLPHVELIGLDMHIGSQVSSFDPYKLGLERLLELKAILESESAAPIRYIDVGGGLAVTYDDEVAADVQVFARVLTTALRDTQVQVIVEPGRFLVGNAGALLTRVLYRKRSGGKEYVITDAGMTDLLRPSHYQAYHAVEAVATHEQRIVADVVGPVCESGDFFALDREIDAVSPGDLIVIRSAGAYGYVMASNYNARPRPAEVLVDGDRFALVTARESYDDLTRLDEPTPEWRMT